MGYSDAAFSRTPRPSPYPYRQVRGCAARAARAARTVSACGDRRRDRVTAKASRRDAAPTCQTGSTSRPTGPTAPPIGHQRVGLVLAPPRASVGNAGRWQPCVCRRGHRLVAALDVPLVSCVVVVVVFGLGPGVGTSLPA